MCDFFDANNLAEFDKDDDRVLFPWANLSKGTRLGDEARGITYANRGAEVLQPPDDLTTVPRNLFIWGHGSTETTSIYKDDNSDALTHSDLAAQLQVWGLPTTFAGNIVVWACWGGREGGLAEMLHEVLLDRGFDELRVWGIDGITCNMFNCQLFVLNEGVEVPPGPLTTEQLRSLQNASRRARRGDFFYYGPDCPE